MRYNFFLGVSWIPLLVGTSVAQIETNRRTIDTVFDGGFWIQAVDFDQDGDVDLVGASLRSGLKWYDNDGSGNFTRRNITDAFDDAWSVHANDVDGDGDLDVVACSETGNKVSWFERLGAENFSERVIDANVSAPHAVYSADLDNDGDTDVIAAISGTDRVLWWENDGAQNFTQRSLSNSFSSAHTVYAADVDLDGDVDVLAGGGGKTAFFRNNGDGTFKLIQLGSRGAFSVLAHDIDGDGRPDVLRNQRDNGDLDWFENLGGSSFAERTVESALGETWGLAAGDLDLDGDQDIVAAAFVPNKISYWLNDGNQNFTETVMDAKQVRPRSVAVADLDNDGDLDIAAVTRTDKVLWYEVVGSPTPSNSLTIVSPNGGEQVEAGSVLNVTWNSTGSIANVNLEYSTDGGTTWLPVATGVANSGAYAWVTPQTPANSVLLRISDAADAQVSDVTDAPFSLVVSTLTVTAPNGGEVWLGNSVQDITWTSTGSVEAVKIEYSLDGGLTWTVVTTQAPNTGTYAWTVPDASTAQAVVRISDAADGTPQDVSDAVFTIQGASLTLTAPNGGESWSAGESQTISWTTTGTIDAVDLEYSVDNGQTWNALADGVSNTGSYVWQVPDVNTTAARVRVSDAADGQPSDVSDGPFSISGSSLTLVAPNGGEVWSLGETRTISWNSTGNINAVSLEYTLDDGQSWTPIVSGINNTGSYVWTIPDVNSDQARVRIFDAADGQPSDVSDSLFTLSGASLTVTSPNGGEIWFDGTVQTITWQFSGLINTVNIEYSLDGGQTWITAVSNLANTGSHPWVVPPVESQQVLLRVSDAADGQPSDVSDGVFTIQISKVTVLEPNGGEVWFSGATQTIRWNSVGLIGNVNIDYSLDNGLTWQIIVANIENDGSHSWEVPEVATETALIRVRDAVDLNRDDVSDAPFTIARTALQVTAPNGGEILVAERTLQVTWTTVGAIDSVDLGFSPDNGATWQPIAGPIANKGHYAWSVPNVRTDAGLVRISDAADGVPADVSDAVFSIIASTLTVTAPNGGEVWPAGGEETITWHSTGVIDSVGLEYSLDNGQTWRSIVSATANDGTYRWRLPNNTSEVARVRVFDAADGTPVDESDDAFAIRVLTDVPVKRETSRTPERFALLQNYPNPFNLDTTIPFAVPRRTTVTLAVFSVDGKRVRTLFDGELTPGSYTAHWDGRDAFGRVVASGIYLYRIRAEGWQASRKLLLVK